MSVINIKIGKTHDNNQNTPLARKNKAPKNKVSINNGPKKPIGLLPPPTLYSLYTVMWCGIKFRVSKVLTSKLLCKFLWTNEKINPTHDSI